MIIFNRLPGSSDGISELSQTDKTSNGSPEMSQLNFSLLLELSGFRFDSLSTRVPTRRSTHMAQMTTRATEAATLVSTKAIRSSMTDVSTTMALVCASTAHAAFARALATAARGTRLASRFLTLSAHRSEMSSLATIAALGIAEPTPRFFMFSFATAGTR